MPIFQYEIISGSYETNLIPNLYEKFFVLHKKIVHNSVLIY